MKLAVYDGLRGSLNPWTALSPVSTSGKLLSNLAYVGAGGSHLGLIIDPLSVVKLGIADKHLQQLKFPDPF